MLNTLLRMTVCWPPNDVEDLSAVVMVRTNAVYQKTLEYQVRRGKVESFQQVEFERRHPESSCPDPDRRDAPSPVREIETAPGDRAIDGQPAALRVRDNELATARSDDPRGVGSFERCPDLGRVNTNV